MDVLEAVIKRRSVREFTENDVSDETVEKILEAGRWAPSGLNNQPWRLRVIRDKPLKESLSSCTKYGGIIRGAPISIAVFLDSGESYDRTKDVQAVGACIQNMLLAVHSLGLGGVWLGEILNKKDEAQKILNVPACCELMAVIAVGEPRPKNRSSTRKSLRELIV